MREKLVMDDRVNFACAANYVKDGEIYNIVKAIIKQIKSNFDFDELQNKMLNDLEENKICPFHSKKTISARFPCC